MALPELKQTQTIIKKAANILLTVPEKPSLDALASMIALYLNLTPLKKDGRVDEVSPSHLPKNLQFLPGSSQIRQQPQIHPDVILDIAGPAQAGAIRQEPLTGGFRLHVTFPTGTQITKDQLEISVRALPYDAIFTFGTADLEALGSLFTDHADFFYNTPIINIDHSADNEHFGTVNLVDITKSTSAEVTYELITSLNNQPLDANSATALYAGIVAGTESFQKPGTSPHAFKVAAALLEAKADRETVIRYLIKTKPLALLKILGRIYARLRHNQYINLFWSILRPIDFQESGATPEDLPLALKELTNNLSDYNAIALLHESKTGTYELFVLIGKGLRNRRAEIQKTLAAKRLNGLLHLNLSAPDLATAETIALDKLKSVLP